MDYSKYFTNTEKKCHFLLYIQNSVTEVLKGLVLIYRIRFDILGCLQTFVICLLLNGIKSSSNS